MVRNDTRSEFERWEELKRLSYVLENQTPFRGPYFSEPDERGISTLTSGPVTDEYMCFHRLLYALELVSPKYTPWPRASLTFEALETLDMTDTCRYITGIARQSRFVEGLLESTVNNGIMQRLARHAYRHALTIDGWPTALETSPDGRVQVGLVCRSLTGDIEGRTTGGRRRCPAHGCPGWLIGVLWETGQQMHICSEGWHFDPDAREVRVVGGGEISARFVSPPPLGPDPLPRDEWPPRPQLMHTLAWSGSLGA